MQAHRSTRRAMLRPTVAAVLALLQGGAAWALPQDGRATFGQTVITRPDGSTLRIDQATPRAGIDWASFSIGAGQTVQVVQPGAQSVLVNRVTGLDPSVILGRLQANGRVFLTNPRGVIFGAGAQVDVGGLVATTLRLGDADAQAGRWWLAGGDGANSVVNEGTLRAGGTIALVGPQVANRGSIEAGRVALGAVSEVQVDLDGDGLILLNARAADGARLDQLGSLLAHGGRAELIAAARGEVAGTVLNLRGAVQSRGLSGAGGEIVIDGGPAGIVEVGSAVDASSAGARGGDVLVLGQKVLLDGGARLDASGATGGGRVRVGGDFQGANPALRNSEQLIVAPGAVADASAVRQGDGGQVVLWADRTTRYFGHVAARGGALGGSGGLAEVSGKQVLEFRGTADLTAPHGATGTLLLDPLDITIDDVFVDTIATPSLLFNDLPSGTPVLAGVDIVALLASSTVVLEAQRDLQVTSNSVPITGSNALTLRAGRDLVVNQTISTNGITLSANDNGGGTATGSGRVVVAASLNAGSGALAITGNGSSASHQLAANLSGNTLDIQGDATLTAAQTWTVAGPSFVSAALSGTGALTKAGAGSLLLSGNSSHGGAITVNAGTLVVAGFNSLATSGITVNGGARLDVDGVSDRNVTLAAGATIGTSNSSGAQIDGTVTLAGDATVDGSNGDVLLGVVAQAGGARNLTTQGVVTFTNGSSYTGTTTVAGGTLTVANTTQSTGFVVNGGGTLATSGSGWLAATPALTLNGGTQLLLGGSETVSSLNGTGSLSLGSNTLSISAGGNFGGVVSGVGGGLTVTGGTLLLSGNNTYTGLTTVSAGTLTAGSDTALGSTATGTLVSAGATLNIATPNLPEPLTLSGSGVGSAGVVVANGTSTAAGGWTLTGDVVLGGSGSLTVSGNIGESFTGRSVTKVGSGTLTLTGANFWGGSTTVGAGTLQAANSGLPPNAPLTLAIGSTLVLQSNLTTGTLQGGGAVQQGIWNLTVGADGGSGTFTGSLNGSGGLVKTGGGSFTLAGTHNATGTVQVAAGSMILGAAERLADTALVTVDSNATLQTGGNETISSLAGNGTVTLGAGTLTFGSGSDSSFGGTVQGSGSLAKVGPTVFTLSGPLQHTGATQVNGGALQVLGSNRLSASGALQVNGGTVDLTGTTQDVGSLALASGTLQGGTLSSAGTFTLQSGSVSSELAGSGALVKAGVGTATLSGNNSYLGATTVSAGTLVVGSNAGLGSPGAGTTVADGATLQIGAVNIAEPLVLRGTGFGGAGALRAVATAGTTGNWVLADDTTVAVTGTLAMAGNVGESRAGSRLTVAGGGRLTLGGSGTWNGGTTVTGSQLEAASVNAVPATALTLSAGGALLLQANTTLGSLQGDGGTSVQLNGQTLTLGSDGTPTLYAGDITGTGNVVKTGAAAFTLAGTANITGDFTVADGSVLLPAPSRLGANAGLAVQSPASVQLAASQQVRDLQLAGSLSGTGTLTGGSYTLAGGTVAAGVTLGNGPVTVTGNSTLQGTVLGNVTVSSGTLVLGSAERIADTALVVVAAPGTLLLNGDETVAGADVQGVVTGTGTLLSNSLLLTGGTYSTPLVAGSIISSGFNTVNATIDTPSLLVDNGTLVLGAANRFITAPAVTVNPGATFSLGGNETIGTLAGSGTVLLNSATLATGSGGSSTFAGSLAGGGTLVKTGGSTFTLDGASSHGSTVVQGGVLAIGSGAGSVSATLGGGPVTNDATLRFDRGGSFVVGSLIGGSGQVQFNGPGSATLTQPNTWAGGTTIAAGTVVLQGANARPGSGAVNVASAASLLLGDGVALPNALLLAGGTVGALGAGTISGPVTLQAASTLSGSGGLLVNGPIGEATAGLGLTTTGSVTLVADNTHTGTTTAAAGGTLTLGDGGATGGVGGPIAIDGTLRVNRSNAVLVTSPLSGAGSVLLDTPGGITLTGANTFAGSTELRAGTLMITGAGAQSGSGSITLTGTTLDITNGALVTAGVVSVGGTVANSSGTGTLAGSLLLQSDSTLASAGGGLALTGDVSGSGGFTKTGTGRVALSGSNGFSGAVNVAAGTLAAGSASALGATGQGTTVASGAALEVNAALAAEALRVGGSGVAGSGVLLGSGSVAGAVTLAADASLGGSLTIAGSIGDEGAGRGITTAGTGTVTLAGSNSYSGSTVVSSGTLALGAVDAIVPSAVVVNGGTLAIGASSNRVAGLQLLAGSITGSSGVLASAGTVDAQQGSIGAVLGGSAGLAKTGSGTVTLAAANTYTGNTSVAAGRLVLAAGQSLAGGLAVSGGTLDLQTSNMAVAGVSLTGGAIDGTTGVLTSGSAFDLQAGSVSAGLAGNVGLQKATTGSVTLAGSSTYTGSTTVSAGTLATTGNERLPDGTAVQVNPAATFAVGGNETVASLALQGTLGGTGTLTAASYAFTGGTATANLGTGALTTSGSSTLGGRAAVASVAITDGTLALGAAGRFSAAPTVTLPGGTTLALGGDEAVGTLTGTGSVLLGSAQFTAGAAGDFTFGGQFSGAGGFTKAGGGTMTLTSAQDYGGSTVVRGGTLRLAAAERLPDSTALDVGTGTTLQLDGDETVASATLGGRLVGPGRLNAGIYALAGGTVDTPIGAGVLTSRGNSTLNATSAATTVTVIDGTLTLGAADRLADTAAVAVEGGATLRLTGDETVQTLQLAGALTGSGTFTALGSYALNDGSRVDVPLGAGTLNVDGDSTLNTVAGATVVNVNAGTLTVSNAGDLANQAAVTVAPQGTLAVAGTQAVGTLNLAGSVAGSGTLAVESVVVSGPAPSVLTTLQVAAPVTVTGGTLTVGDGATTGALVAPATTVESGATLAFNRGDAITVGTIGGSGTLRQEGGGTLQLAGTVANIGAVQVAAGNLALAGGNQINDAATVSVARGGTLTLAGSGENVASLDLQGRLAGAGATLNAASYTLAGGVTEANLGAGTLVNTGGSSVLGGRVGASTVTVSGGSLAVEGSQALTARPGLDVQAGATLRLAGSETVGTVTNAGTLVTGTALTAASIASPGAVQVGGTITTTGGQTYGGALTAAGGSAQLVAGGDIVALASGNDFGSATLGVQARSLRLFAGASGLRLGTVALEAGDSSVTTAGRLVLAGATTLAGGSLTLTAQAGPSDGEALAGSGGVAALLPDPSNGAASGTRLVAAAPVISQTAEGTVTTAAGTTLRLRAPGGGSIELDHAGNAWGGTVSAVSGTAGAPFSIPTGQGSVRLSRVLLEADALRLAGDDGTTLGAPQGLAAGDHDAIRADVVQLRAATITTAPGAAIRARLPYSVNQGPNSSAPALVIDTGAAPAGGGVYGTADNPLALVVNPATLGIGGLFLSVLPEPGAGGSSAQRLFFGCAGCSEAPVYLFAGNPLAAQAFFNGSVLGTAPLAASVINNNTTLLENARRTLFEGAVRTENVAPRLRAGVIAEVGVGRPATEGAGGIAKPALCDAPTGSLDCAGR